MGDMEKGSKTNPSELGLIKALAGLGQWFHLGQEKLLALDDEDS